MTRTLIAFLLLSAAAPARAELKPGHSLVGVAVGSAGTGTQTDWRGRGGNKEADYDAGSAFSLQYLRQLSRNLGVGAELEYSNHGQRDHDLTSYKVRMGGHVFTAEALVRYAFRAEKRVRPFLTAGLGLATQRSYALTTPRAGVTWADTGTRETRTNWDTTLLGTAASLGVGLEGDVNERFMVGLDVRLRSRGIDKTVADGALGGTRDFSGEGAASVLLRMTYKFGGDSQAAFLK